MDLDVSRTPKQKEWSAYLDSRTVKRADFADILLFEEPRPGTVTECAFLEVRFAMKFRDLFLLPENAMAYRGTFTGRSTQGEGHRHRGTSLIRKRTPRRTIVGP